MPATSMSTARAAGAAAAKTPLRTPCSCCARRGGPSAWNGCASTLVDMQSGLDGDGQSRRGSRTRSRAVSCGRRSHSDRRELMAEVDGATLVARSLKRQGVQFMFGIVGFPGGPDRRGRAEGGDHLRRDAQRAVRLVCRAGRWLPDRAPRRLPRRVGPRRRPRPRRPRQRAAERLADDPHRRRLGDPGATAWARSRKSARC